MPTIDYGSGYNYFNKHACIIPDRTTLEVSEDCKTVTIIANENTCFGPTEPTITIWLSNASGDIGPTHVPMEMSEDRKRLTYTLQSQVNFIYKCQVENAWTYNPGFEPTQEEGGQSSVASLTNARTFVTYDPETGFYTVQAVFDWGLRMADPDNEATFWNYDDGYTSPQLGCDYDYAEGGPYKRVFLTETRTVKLKKNAMFTLKSLTTATSETSPAITNNTQHTSYVIRTYRDEVNETWKPVLEINFDNCWYPRSTFQALVNNVPQTLDKRIDFYYTRSCKVLCDIANTQNAITLSGGVYHRAWPYLASDGYSDEDKIIYDCPEGRRIKRDMIQGEYHDMLWISVNNVKYWFTLNDSKTSGWIDASFYQGGQTPIYFDALTVYANTEAIPQVNVALSYTLTNCHVDGTAPQTTSLASRLQLTLIADDGYQFNTPPTVSYINDWDNRITVNGTVSGDKKTAYIDWNPNTVSLADSYRAGNGTFWIGATAATAPPAPFEATIVNNISGTTYTQTNGTINVYAPTGYVFSAAPTLDWTDGTNSGTANFTLAADGKSASINANAWKSSAYTLTIQGAIEEEHTWGPSSITNNVANTTHSLSGTTLTVVCDTGYVFDAAPVIAQAGSAGPITMTLNSSGTIASADITAYDELAVVITGSTSESTEPPTPSTNHTVYTRLTNCTGSGIPGAVDDDDTLNITLTANTGYEFDADYLPSVEYIKTDNLTYREYFTLSSDGSTATITLNTANLALKADSALTVVGQAYETEPTPPGPEPPFTEKYGLVNIYTPTASELQQFAAQRFRYDQNLMPFDDLGNYVTSLKRVYVPMPSTTSATISAGRYNTNIATNSPTTDMVTLDFGAVTIPAHNNTALDYSGKVSVFLPFVGFADVSAEYVGTAINLVYEVNIVTGEGVAKLSHGGIVFAIYPCRPSSDMAYRSNTMMSQTLGGSEFNTQYLYGLKPYVIVKWYTSKNRHLLNPDSVRINIGSYQGYAKFNEVTDINNGQITADEKNLLIRTLAAGVYIEETNEP